MDSAGNLFVADTGNQIIRKITASTGIITTVAGNGQWGFSGDGGPATNAELKNVAGVAVDSSGNFFIADYQNCVIRRVDAMTQIITTVAGTVPGAGGSNCGFGGDGGPATTAILSEIIGLALDSAGNLFIADTNNGRIREVTASNGIINTVAGGGTTGLGDGGPATNAELLFPTGVAVDSAGNLFIADQASNRIRQVTASTGIITTVAGGGTTGLGDGGPATSAVLVPFGVAVDSAGNLFIGDIYGNRVREVYPPTIGFSLTLAENGNGSGTGLSIPDGISCGSTCSDNFPARMIVTLNAYPAAGSIFAGWSGACSGLSVCSVLMNADQSVTATFNIGPDFSVEAASASLTTGKRGL